MKKTEKKYLLGQLKTPFFAAGLKTALILILAVFICLPLHGQAGQRDPISVNLIIDGSASLSGVKNEITTWLFGRLDQILVEGDRVTVWSAGSAAKVVYSGKIGGNADKDAVKKSIRDLAGAGNSADFSGALREAAAQRSDAYSYTLLVSTSSAALSSVISGPQSNLMRFSRIEEFPAWRAVVVGLNIDAQVKKAAAAFFGS